MNTPDYKHNQSKFTTPCTGDLEHGCKCNTVSNAQGRVKRVKRRYSLSLSRPICTYCSATRPLIQIENKHCGYNSDSARGNYMEMLLDGDRNSKL